VSNRISLKETERKVFKSAFQDGLVDISIGSVILMFAIAPFLSPYLGDFWSSAVFLPFWGIVFSGIWLIRKYIVRPRAGTVKYGSWPHTARFSLILLVGFSLAGYFLEFPRLYLYGVLLALAPLIGELLYVHLHVPHHGFPVVFGAAASLMIGTGLVLFIRLLRDHPLQPHQAELQEGIE
jgi:hypothetical protein